jgi:tetratricopeptide (TPR) repeat protein
MSSCLYPQAKPAGRPGFGVFLGAFLLASALVADSRGQALGEEEVPQPGPPQTSSPPIRWRHDYVQARAEAVEKKMPLFLDIGTEACYWCKQLDLRTFVHPEVAGLLNKRFIPLKIDARQEENVDLVRQLRIQSYPTLVYARPDGRILGYQEGFLGDGALKEQLLRVLALTTAPAWMQRDYDEARRLLDEGSYTRAMVLLRNVVDDGRDRPVQEEARKLLKQIESTAEVRLSKVKELLNKGKELEAREVAAQLVKLFEGTAAAREGRRMLLTLSTQVKAVDENREQAAQTLLERARIDFRDQRFHCCLDRCEILTGEYADRPEAKEAKQLIADITSNPEWATKACQQLADRLSMLYLAQAESWLKKGQPQQAIYYLERIVRTFPGSKHAEAAQVRLLQLQGSPRVGDEDMGR